MKKLWWVFLAGFVMIALALGYWATNGNSHVIEIDVKDRSQRLEDYNVTLEPNESIVSLRRVSLSDGILRVTVVGEKTGKAYVDVYAGGEGIFTDVLYVHPLKMVTRNSVFGYSDGAKAVLIAVFLFVALLFLRLLFLYFESVREERYRYRNIMLLGLLVFLGFSLLYQFLNLVFGLQTIEQWIVRLLSSFGTFAYGVLPVAFVLAILVTISNIDLLRKEGKRWQNLLGVFLGLLLLGLTVSPLALSEFLQRSTLIDVHDQSGAALYIEEFVEYIAYALAVYLECILVGAIYHGYKAARHIPSFDKDYILILGCMIRKDGTLTPLLRGRVDRAIEFARMQKEATGKDIIFVPSGGQGSDEVIAEAEAMYNYLVEQGIPKEQILVENQSKNTFENFTYSKKLIEEHATVPDPKIAFSTTNYHVFRSGFYAHKQGMKVEGIGSKTKVYYWVNAYIREWIATMRSEWKVHVTVLVVLVLLGILLDVAYWAMNRL